MSRIEGSTSFARPAEEVFDFLADPRNEPAYNPLIQSARKLTPGPIDKGSRFIQHVKTVGRVGDVTIDLVECERPRQLVWEIHTEAVDVRGTEELTATPDGTAVHWVWEIKTHGARRLLGPLISLVGKRTEPRLWSDLERHLQAGGPAL